MVVLASHWSPTCAPVAPLGDEALALESGRATSLASVVKRWRRARREPRQRVDQRAADAPAGEFGIDIEHVDLLAALRLAKPAIARR